MNIKYDHQQPVLCCYNITKQVDCCPVADDKNLKNMTVIL